MPLTPSASSRGTPLSLTGAVAPTRYVGGNASGAPASGAFLQGDFVVNGDGSVFVCTVAGSPGTWVSVGGGAPTGAAGGDLGSTYPNPTVVNLHLSGDTAIGHKLTSVTDPASAQDAATKNYVDTQFSAVNPAVAVTIATTAAGDTSGLSYSNGVAGVGATLTGSVNTALTIDGVTLNALNQRVLVKNDTQAPSGAFNGIYFLSQLQTGILAPILTRALDYDQTTDINSTGAIPVISGTANAGSSWLLTSSVTTVGTSPLTFIQFSVAATARTMNVYTSGTPTWTKPVGATTVRVVCIGAGGQGGGGYTGSGAASLSGGGGGGGGGVTTADFQASDVGATVSVTVGAGGSAAGAPGSPGSAGTDGTGSSFGSLLKAGGGGGGAAGTSGGGASGGGGGSQVNTATGSTAGTPSVASAAIGGQALTGAAATGGGTEWGGSNGAGRGTAGGPGNNGGASIYGGPGGGMGGGATSTTGQNGGTGGGTQAYGSAGGGTGGTGGGSPTGGASSNGAAGPAPYCGAGGGGGGGASTGVVGANGGAGGIGAGGGGGGASASTTGGTGGGGGTGRVIVITW